MLTLNKTKYLEPEELKELNSRINSYKRDHLIIKLLLNTGARAQELLNIKKSDLSTEHYSVLIRGLKGSNDREIPLAYGFYMQLKRFASSHKNERLFPISYQRLYQIWVKHRPAIKKLHATRHTFAMEVYRKTKDIRIVQVALGHKSIATSEVYTKYAYTMDELKKALL